MSGACYRLMINLSAVVNLWPPLETGSLGLATQKSPNTGRNLQSLPTAADEFPAWTYANWLQRDPQILICSSANSLCVMAELTDEETNALHLQTGCSCQPGKPLFNGCRRRAHPNCIPLLPGELSHAQQCGLIGHAFFFLPLTTPYKAQPAATSQRQKWQKWQMNRV